MSDDYRIRDVARETVKGGISGLMIGVVTLVVVLAIFAVGVFGFGWFQRSTANFRGKTNEINQVNSGNYRMAAYDSFYDECAAVQTDETRISNAQAALKSNKDPDRTSELQANLTAAQNQRAADINSYNADARKADTKAHFRASDLPYQIDSTEKETTCQAN